MPDVSVIIVNYNVRKLILDCLNSLYKYLPADLTIETIVVDNNSSDKSVEAIRASFPQVIVIENKYNAGFSGANNQGMRISKGDFIFLLNPDTELTENAIKDLKNYLDDHTDCAIVVPQLLNSDTTIQNSVWKDHRPVDLILETFYLHKFHQRLDFTVEQKSTTFEVKSVSGAALMFRKELIQKIGMLDENLFWMEDIDFSKRAENTGKLIYLHSAVVIHHSGQSQKKNYDKSIANQLISKLKYYKKYNSRLGLYSATLSCFIFIISRLVVFMIISPVKEIYRLKRNAYFYSFRSIIKYLFTNNKKIS